MIQQQQSMVWLALVAILLTMPTTTMAGSSSSSSAVNLDEPFQESFSRLDHAPCVSLFYRNGRVGCATDDYSLQIGQLEYFDGETSLDINEPYVAVMEDCELQQSAMALLVNQELPKGQLQGVLVLNSTNSENNNKEASVEHWYSPEPMAPQGYGTPSADVNYGNVQYGWNSLGSGIMLQDLRGLPVAYVKDSDVSQVLRQEAQDSSTHSEIVAEFNYYMGPENMNSVDCLAWKDSADNAWNPKCLPLGGSSVWAAAGPPPGASQSNQDDNGGDDNNYDNAKPILVVGAGMDATSFFHDLVPGASSAASNILTLLMAAKLVGGVDDATLDSLQNQIVFGLFQAESHGFVGSRNFFRDLAYPGFECNSDKVRPVPRLENDDNDNGKEYACLNPLYPSLGFSKLGEIAGMLALDQLGVITTDGYFYVHADENNDDYGAFLSNILQQLYTNSGYKVYESSASENNNGNNGNGYYPYPPTPLTSLLSLSQGAKGGAVLTGYDFSFSNNMPYHSFKETGRHHSVSLESIAAAATLVARAAIAAAYDGGNNNDYETAAAYAANLIPELDADEGSLVALYNCLLYDGTCSDLGDYASVRAKNERDRTGFNVGQGVSLGNPPNYYVGVYNGMYGQPFVQVGDKTFGRYTGDAFGNHHTDAIAQQPTVLENAAHGLLDDFLGRGAADFAERSCHKASDCQNSVDFCQYDGEWPTCTGGGVCVCARAHFHRALDEALIPAADQSTGYFEVSENDPGVSPMYTEPYWSNSVGVRVYRDVGPLPGLVTLVAGAAGMATSLCAAFLLRVGLKKEKLY